MKATLYHPSRHLKENEIYPIGENCPICNNISNRSKSSIIQSSPDIWLMTCEYCKGSFASFMPFKNVLDNYYENYYSDDSPSITFNDSIRFARHILKPLNFDNKKEISILDFGGGGGDISHSVAKEIIKKFPNIKVNIMIIDYENTEKKVDGNIVINSEREIEQVSLKKYDLVIASAVLEHIPDLYKIITKLFSMVKENGYFYARTPYIEPFMRLNNKIDMTYPAHLYDLGGNYWNNIISTYNLNAVILNSRPSIVETGFRQSFFRTLIAYILKIPGYLESKFSTNKNKIYWKYVGGWEIYLKISSNANNDT